MGTPEFAVPPLKALIASHEVVLVITRPDEPSGRGMKLSSPPVAEVARAANLPVLQPQKIRTPEFYETLRQAKPDVAVVVAYGKILPREILEIPPLGCVNVHASLLPKYRGAAPIQWAIARGETETGVTIMKMDEGMDTGPILRLAPLPIAPEDTAESLAPKLSTLGAEVLLTTLSDYAEGKISPQPQPEEGASLAPILKKEDGRIDWSRPAKEIVHLVRGMRPWPVAHTTLPWGDHLRVLLAKETEGKGAPGEVLVLRPKAKDLAFVVAAGEGAVALLEVQQQGRKVQPGHTFAMGGRLSVGDRLGEP